MRSPAVSVILLAILTAGPTLGARAEGPAPLPVEAIAPGVYVHHGVHAEASVENEGGIANIGFVIGDAAVAVIDSGGSPMEGAALLRAIRQVTPLPVRYVINTHFHPDHVLGNATFAALGAEIIGHKNLPMGLLARRDTYVANYTAVFGADSVKDLIVVPSHLVADRETIDLGHRILEIRAFPTAHTDSDLIVIDRESKTLFAGDLVFLERVPASDGSILGWLKAIAQLREIPAARVVPGHGPVTAPWPAALDPEQAYFERLVRDIRKLLAEGGSLQQATDTIGLSERGHWQLFDSYNARNVTTAYTELEWE
ncbi:quinoprotein relay system zinc metallohydrolase 2 [Dongia sedimenti]|uniref:Quinoprotein relay system zinc metallohydrolase 2 n=1 Tax=Dongia sedimenti TaxID=3064282 RepID=A0ABU0YWV6_9PROT|nr:quinoprotein relay system zinc metallohydrolase 2 [Rhodospirillaceae bacterium R-7]